MPSTRLLRTYSSQYMDTEVLREKMRQFADLYNDHTSRSRMRTQMKTLLIIAAILILLVIALLFTLKANSTIDKAPGLAQGMLSRCPDTPNCVCSQYEDAADHYIHPLAIPPNTSLNIPAVLKEVVQELGGKVQTETDNYLAATFTSTLFKFTDDLELTIDLAQGLIHIRSAARVGYSDMGVNRKRVERLKELFNQRVPTTSR